MSVELIRSLIRDHTNLAEETRVVDLVRALEDDEITELLTPETADLLMASIDDHLFGPDERTALVHHLTRERGPRLELHARAALLRALQSGHTTRDLEDDICELVLQVRGNDLTHLKNIVDQAKDRHNLQGLVFGAIDSAEVRQRVLDHIAREAAALASDTAGEPAPQEAKVLSDIDDIVFCKLHDKRYPKGILYPGVLAFQEALDEGPHDDPLSMGDITFVTARPKDVFGLVAGHSRESLNRAGVAELSMMSGSLSSLLSLDAMAGKKVENITQYCQLFPEYDIVFMGDSGQGDVRVGEQLWEKFPELLKGVFIHDVVGTPEERRAEYAAERIWFHDTYVGAAARARELGLISTTGLQHVVEEAFEQFEAIAWEDEAQRERMLALFERDRATAEQTVS